MSAWSGFGRVSGWALALLLVAGCGAGSIGSATSGDRDLDDASLTFHVAAAGARIVQASLPGGANLLTGAAVDPLNFGSTFWTSPQSAWAWPPPAAFDTATYVASGSHGSLSFDGPADLTVGAQISKRFTAGASPGTVTAVYRITAAGRDGKFAPWEVTRVWPGGLTFFSTGAGSPRAGGGFALPPTQEAAGCTWYQHPGNAPGADQKLLADGAGGWLAHVAGDVVLVKTFAAVSAAQVAPGEGEIEIFVDGQGRYVELEEQGAYQPLPRGQTLAWPVTWIIRKLPAGLDATLGSPSLVAFVEKLVGS